MNTYGQVSAWISMAGGVGWSGLGAYAVAGRLRPPRAWARAGSRWGWCQVLLGAGIACFPADALLGNRVAPTPSAAGVVLVLAGMALLFSSGRGRDGPAPDDSPTQPIPQLHPASPHAPTRPGVHPQGAQ